MKNKSRIFFFLTVAVLATQVVLQANAQKDKRKKSADAELLEEKRRNAEFVFTEGMRYFILEDYSKALGAFQAAAELRPTESMAYYKIAEILLESSVAKDLDSASVNIERAIKLDKKNPNFYPLAARIYVKQNNLPKAEQALETLTRDVDVTGEHLFELAGLYLKDKKPEEALKVLNRAEGRLGISEMSSVQKQFIYFDQGKIAEAIAEGEKLMALYPDEERIAMRFAEMLSQKGQQKKAIEILEKFLASHPESGLSKLVLADLYRGAGREKESRDLIQQAMTDPSVDITSKVYVLQMYAAQITQNTARNTPDPELNQFAAGLFLKLQGLYSDDPNLFVAGGNLYISLQQKREAERAFLSAIQHGSASFEAWQNLLALEAESGKFDSLVFHAEQGLEIFPNQALLYYFKGYGNLSTKKYREAASALEQAKKLSSANPGLVHDINSMLGDAYNGSKEYAKSDQAFEAALAHSPNDVFVLNNYSYYLALRKDHLEKAERMAAQATKDQPNNSTYLDTYAWVLFAHEKYREARKVMEHALELPGVSSVHFDHYGDILFQLGDIDGAVKQWEKARSMTHDHASIDKKIANRRLN